MGLNKRLFAKVTGSILATVFVLTGLLIAFSKVSTGDPFMLLGYLHDRIRYATWTDAEKEQILVDRVEKVPGVLETEFTEEPALADHNDRFLNVMTRSTNREFESKLRKICSQNGLWQDNYNVTCQAVSIESESHQIPND